MTSIAASAKSRKVGVHWKPLELGGRPAGMSYGLVGQYPLYRSKYRDGYDDQDKFPAISAELLTISLDGLVASRGFMQ